MAQHGFKQDMPPAGGYEAVRYRRSLPIRGPGGAVVFSAITAVCAFGFWRVGAGNLEKRELRREQAWSRIHLVPLVLAEQDRDAYRRQQAALAREKEIMGDVPGWEAGKSVYNNPRYTPATIAVL
ncbi:hypothetical protein Q5752_000910 [Cryptotrichosporon argae]